VEQEPLREPEEVVFIQELEQEADAPASHNKLPDFIECNTAIHSDNHLCDEDEDIDGIIPPEVREDEIVIGRQDWEDTDDWVPPVQVIW